MPPLVAHAPEKLLAKQWLQAYQYASTYVPPLILSGTICNALLAYSSPTLGLKLLYGSAAALVWVIIPVTLFYFEPNVNGSGKWKAQKLLQEDGYYMREQKGRFPSPEVHTATPEARRWAEAVAMRDIVKKWARLNAGRFVVTAIAMLLSATATCTWGTGLP